MKKTIFFLIVLSFSLFRAQAQLMVTQPTSLAQMVNGFILSGVTAANITYTGNTNALGSFNNGNTTSIGLNDGIILTTGTASGISNPSSYFLNFSNNNPGDSLLNTLITQPTYDAAVLEFDLIPVGNVLEFQYVFASEEYPEWVGSGFNDLFGFFISGPDSAGGSFINKNIAIVPNTTSTVVSVNNINNGTTNAGPCMNCAYYVDNTNDTTIAFDGFTTVLVAQVSVIPLATYHLKMAIADASDNVYDTGIFLKAQSMKSYSTSTPVIPQLVMSPPASLTQMVNDFILSGVTANNMSYTGDSSAVGVFSDGNLTNLGLTNGIFLTTGVINGTPAIGDSAMLFANTFNNTAGDALLHSLIPSSPTFDASVLEFDLVPSGNILEFQYVFASEEYPEFVGSNFNDVFGFFINGLDPAGGYYVDKNLAIIPGTSSVVCVNNVNDTTNASYYVNNQNGGTLVFDGFTTVLLAQANVIPSTTYHLKMAIADVADGSFDSGIFLKAQSMKSYSNVSVKENQGQHFYIAPNPVNADSKLTVNLQTSGKVKINITDISGKKVYSNEINFTSAGMQQISLSDFMNTTKAGIYMISIEANNFSETQKIIRY